ncbi:diguanylate cyclase with GAF sensor [Anaerobacterium chartisolvens]|uniref:Diguanylate cyclase with GAF sensor n=1 Tax=Anaerobacterium chartisolvens TaxID=1297424 RepID=A0A369AV84_9FIRM|nr:GGDEF domain-containing protein [Anaerobacterium chartisolvens]RCX12973.1 diguanylate cyclase with GAF sensor [Anaerobacterium chartisolvens]
MDRVDKYDQMYLELGFAFILIGFFYIAVHDVLFAAHSILLYHLLFFAFIMVYTYLKHYMVKKNIFKRERLIFVFKIMDISFFSFGIVYLNIGEWAYIFTILILAFTSLVKGKRQGLLLVAILIVTTFLIYISYNISVSNQRILLVEFFTSQLFFQMLFYYITVILFVMICSKIQRNNMENEEENKKLLAQLEEKYQQLEAAQDEIKIHYGKLKDTNIKLEDTNKKLTSSIAEFYTLQQITQAISSIFDINELLKYVNDIILGVMGVSYSTIILYDEKKSKLTVHTTNIKNKEELDILNNNINCNILMNALNNSKPIIENFADSDEYVFTDGRDVNSLICVPLSTKTRKFGLVLIEQKYYGAFDDENVRLLDIIGQQVGIALENAELYQKMHELATIDGLTGIYNRLYFQERLQKEFSKAQKGGYNLSVAIFDIDHFKRFNDTFGHLFGDKVLKSIAGTVKDFLRSTDVFARYGGEEFIILFPRTSTEEAYEKVEALRKKINQHSIKDNLVTACVTVSFGIACFPESAVTESEFIRKADDALYAAKNAGRNCVKVADVWIRE